jgi:iron complex transport system ATP-binding protein
MNRLPRVKKQPVLEIQNLGVTRNGTRILDRLHWSLLPRQHWVILGPNGSGKSSLLAALAGYLTPTEGQCSVLGQTFGECDWRDLRLHLGIVSASAASMVPPEEPAAYTVTAGKYAQFGLWGDPTAQDHREALRWLRYVEATHLANRPWEVLSQGEKQRVLIARALILKPKLLILDEPCAGMDPLAREAFLGFLQRLLHSPRQPSIVLVTHHVEEIVPGFTHALLLKRGKVHQAGPLAATLSSRSLKELFETPLQLRKKAGRFHLSIRPKPALFA